MQSLLSKKKEIEQRVKDHDFDLMFFTEVWTDEHIDDSEYFIPGFQKPIVDPNLRGGACVYIRDGIEFLLIEPPSKVKESVWFVVSTNDSINRLYACVYRSPNSLIENNENLIANISWAKERFSEVVMIGDINLPQVD